MQPKNWTPRRRIEEQYRRVIIRLLDKYLNFPDSATLGQITEALVNFSNVTSIFEEAVGIASRMATAVKVENARSWREAARLGSRGRQIYASLQGEMGGRVGERVDEIVRENALLISSIPREITESVTTEILGFQQKGIRHESMARYLRGRIPELTRSRATLIARTETSKSATALTRARSEDLGLEWYMWATNEDARVRVSHRHMDKVLVNWNDPPSPEALLGIKSTLGKYHAGNCPNCRCDSYPVLALADISWPHRVYMQGRIRRMNLGPFKLLAA